MYVELKNYTVNKVRKKHQCIWCGELIPIGESAHYRAYVFDGDFQQDYMHKECEDASQKWFSESPYDDEGFDEFMFVRGTTKIKGEEESDY